MKSKLFIFFLILILSFSLIACKVDENQPQPIDEPTEDLPSEDINPSIEENPPNESANEIIEPQLDDPREKEPMTKLSDFSLDLDGDGSEENIELYTSAERHEDGNLIWDDGQNWLLLVQDEEEYYPLLQQYVQLGLVYFTVWYDEDEVPKITSIVNTGANLNLINYTYDQEFGGYNAEKVYDTGAINLMFTSIPGYYLE